MSKPAFTPGPWRVVGATIRGDGRGTRCDYLTVARATSNETSGYDCPPPQVAEANARLIAAAPELFDALKLLVLAYESDAGTEHDECLLEESHKRSVAALAKAEGRTP